MRNLISNISMLIVAIISFTGGIIWGFKSSWEIEPLIIASVSFIEILTYLIFMLLPSDKAKSEHDTQYITNKAKIKKQSNVKNNSGKIDM